MQRWGPVNMVYSGCSILTDRNSSYIYRYENYGDGQDCEICWKARLVTQTPLQKSWHNWQIALGIMALAACAVIFVVGLIDGIARWKFL